MRKNGTMSIDDAAANVYVLSFLSPPIALCGSGSVSTGGKKISFAPGKTGSFSSWCICAFCEEKEDKTRIALSSRAYISKQWVPNGIRRLTSLHLLLLSQTRHVDAPAAHRTSTLGSIADQRIPSCCCIKAKRSSLHRQH